MATTLLNPTLWLLATLCASASWAALRRAPASDAVDAFLALATRPLVLVLLLVLALAGVGSRIVFGALAPGAYAEEVVQARAYLADRGPSTTTARDELAAWLREEPAAVEPWLIPGLSACEAGALRDRARFFSGHAHSPALLLASVPIVRVAGGRGVFLWLTLCSLAGLALAWWTLAREAGWPHRSARGVLLGVALAGWQPVLAGLRQGDAVLVAGALIVGAWAAARHQRWTLAGALAGVAGAIFPPALVAVLALARRPRALAAAVAACSAVVLATVALAGPEVLADFARNVAFTTRTYAHVPVNYAVAGRALDLLAPAGVAALAAAALLVTIARLAREDAAIAALCPLAVLAAPVAFSQHLFLVVTAMALLARAALRSPAALAGWAVLAAMLSLPDPLVARAGEVLSGSGDVVWPVVPIVLVATWTALLLARGVPRSRSSTAVSPIP